MTTETEVPSRTGERGGGDGAVPWRARRAEHFLRPVEHAAAMAFVRAVRREVPADLVAAYLFGSRARRQARPDSDLDVLLVFRWLPPGREPQAEMAEAVAERVAEAAGVPVATWSVSLPDLERGVRTPMLVDALEDSVPLWPRDAPDLRVPFTPDDAFSCTGALLDRVEEGSGEVAEHRRRRDLRAAHRRVRDDLVRLCTAALLLAGETRPRRGDAVRRFARCWAPGDVWPRLDPALLAWAAGSFGERGDGEDLPVAAPPGGLRAAARQVDALRAAVARLRSPRPASPGGNPVSRWR